MAKLAVRSFVLLALAAPLALGCEFSVGGAEVGKAAVEEQAMKAITASVGQPSPQVTCPGSLKGVVGTKLVCSMPVGDQVADVTITVTSVEGSNVKFDVKTSPRS